MNTYFLLAASISAVGGVLHSILGERLLLSKLASGDLPETLGSPVFALRVLRLFWHLVSVAWWGFAALLVLLASMPASVPSGKFPSSIGDGFRSPVRRAMQQYRESCEGAQQSWWSKSAPSGGGYFPDGTLVPK